jgi:hypothetical protein
MLEKLLGSGVDLGLRGSLSRPLNDAGTDAIAGLDHYARQTGVGPETFPLGWVGHVGFVLRFDGVD